MSENSKGSVMCQIETRPKTLARIREERLAAKEQMKAVNHILQQLNLDFDEFIPEAPLRPIDALSEKRRSYFDDKGFLRPFVVNTETGASRWDEPISAEKGHKRLTLCPDEGSSLYTVYQYLSGQGFAVHLNRDSLQPSQKHAFQI